MDRTDWFVAILVITTLGIFWGLWNTRRVIEAPFLLAVGLMILLVPQLYFVLLNPWRVPDDGYWVFCLMVCLCSLALYIGYALPTRLRRARFEYGFNDRRLFQLGILIAGLGTLGYAQVFAMGTIDVWRGWAVYWVTLAKLTLPGLTLLVLAFMQNRSFLKFGWVAVFAIFPMLAVVLFGRRSMTLLLPIVLLLPYLIYSPRYKPSRVLVLAALFGAFVVVYAFPYWRGDFMDYRHVEAVERLPLSQVVENVFRSNSNKVLEVVDAIVVVGAQYNYGQFDWRLATVYNNLIGLYVPGGLLGYELKASLMVKTPDLGALASYYYRIPVANYTAKTGFADLYTKFSFFGALVALLIGRVFRYMSELMRQNRDGRAILFLCFFISIPASLTYDALFYSLLTQLPTIFIFVVALKFCVRKRKLTGSGIRSKPSIQVHSSSRLGYR